MLATATDIPVDAAALGKLDPSGRISINPDLIRAPTACIDYVITHELIHLIHPHHGQASYDSLDTLMPDGRSRKQGLERLLFDTAGRYHGRVCEPQILLCMGLFSSFLVTPRGRRCAASGCRVITHPARRRAAPHAVFAAFSPSLVSTASRIKNFWIFPVTVIGNSSTNST
jgi:hypothetical protein